MQTKVQGHKLSHIKSNQISEGISNALMQYMQTDKDTRRKLEAQGVNLARMIFERLVPVIESTSVGHVLIIMEEGIGNMVMLTPALRILKTVHPLLKVTVWCKNPANQLIEGLPYVDKVITEFDYGFYDLCFASVWSQKTMAQHNKTLTEHCKMVINVPLKKHHESIQHLSVAEFLDAYGDMCLPEIYSGSTEARAKIYDMLEKASIRTTLSSTSEHRYEEIVIFGDTTLNNHGWDRKRWPYYKELAERLYEEQPSTAVILIGDKADKKRFEKIDWPSNVIMDFAGTINLAELAQLLQTCKAYIGNDTGPTHMAAALGVKTYAIFGPTLISKNKPLGPDVTILCKRLPCQPCQYTDMWDKCGECDAYMTSGEIYGIVFEGKKQYNKPRIMVVGDFSEGALRNEHYIKLVLERDLGCKSSGFDYRKALNKFKNPVEATYDLLNEMVQQEPDLVIINGGQQLVPEILAYTNWLLPNTKLANWYVDNRQQPEQWFAALSSVCHTSYWSTGDPGMLSAIYSQTYNPCRFLPIVPDAESYYPDDTVTKDIDVLFIGTPHSEPRIKLLEYLVDHDVNVQIYGNGEWPEKLQPCVHPGVFGQDALEVMQRAKIILGINIFNDVPLYFSDRYFYPMAVKTVGLNKFVPRLEEMFEDHKHMVFFRDEEDCVKQVKKILENKTLQDKVSKKGYELFKEKYTLRDTISFLLSDNGVKYENE